MGEAARRRRAAAAGSRPGPAGRASAAGTDPREEAVAAMARLLRGNRPGRVSLAGAYALGYGALGMAQHDDDGPDWFHELDPLDTLFLGTAFPGEFHDEYEFGNARTAWLRQMRTTAHWRGIERFVAEVVQASQDHQMPVDEGELMLLVAGRLEAAGLDQRKLPATLLPGTALADARFLRGPDPTLVLPTAAADAAEHVARLRAGTQVNLAHDGTCADALREGLHLLGRTGIDVRADPAILLIALYLALVAADSEQLSDAPPRAEAWALGLAEDSPLVPAVDVLLLAADRGLDVDATLGHLFAVPAFTQPVPDGDRRFTSAPGGALTDVAFELGFRQVDTRDAKVLAMDADAKTMFPAPPTQCSSTPTPTNPAPCRLPAWNAPAPTCCGRPACAGRGSTPASTPAGCCHAPTAPSTPPPTLRNGRRPSTGTCAPIPAKPSTRPPNSPNSVRCSR